MALGSLLLFDLAHHVAVGMVVGVCVCMSVCLLCSASGNCCRAHVQTCCCPNPTLSATQFICMMGTQEAEQKWDFSGHR